MVLQNKIVIEFEEVLACLENTDKREEFIERLKNAGEYSTSFLHLQSAIMELKMDQAPRGIHQKHIIQHMLRFSDTDECFQKFRLVCKSWKDAVETIRFNRMVGPDIFYNLDDIIIERKKIFSIPYFSKYLPLFKKLSMPMVLANKNKIFTLVLQNMKKLNKIIFDPEDENVGQECDYFIIQMLQNSHTTLHTLHLPKFAIPDIFFPKLTKLELIIGTDILLNEFQIFFPQALKNMKNLEEVVLDLYD